MTTTRNLLDSIVLSPAAVLRWQQTASAASIPPAVHPSEIPDEDAEVLPDGSLRIFVELRDGERIAQADIPAPDWAWAPNAKH